MGCSRRSRGPSNEPGGTGLGARASVRTAHRTVSEMSDNVCFVALDMAWGLRRSIPPWPGRIVRASLRRLGALRGPSPVDSNDTTPAARDRGSRPALRRPEDRGLLFDEYVVGAAIESAARTVTEAYPGTSTRCTSTRSSRGGRRSGAASRTACWSSRSPAGWPFRRGSSTTRWWPSRRCSCATWPPWASATRSGPSWRSPSSSRNPARDAAGFACTPTSTMRAATR